MAEDNIPSMLRGKTEADSGAGAKLYDLKQIKGLRTSFSENNQYRVDNLSYPIDLLSQNTENSAKYQRSGNNQYGSNYVVFYINVNAASKLLKDTDQWYGNKTVGDVQADKTRLAGMNINSEQAATGSAIESAVAGGLVSGNIKGAAKGGAIGFIGTEVIGSQTSTFSKQMKRLQTAIALHTPNQLTAHYSANWDTVDTNIFQLAMKGGETLVNAVKDGYNKQNVSPEYQDAKTIGAAVSLNTIPGKDSISAITGLAPNPKKEQVFRGVDFRTWNFEYQFYPRSKEEYQNVQNIIYMFKLHMHPEYKDANNFLYLYPSEFDIVHYNGVDENFNLPRHSSCVLTEMTVNYAPQSQFTSFEGGAPTQINISLTFKELVQMSKERIQEGY